MAPVSRNSSIFAADDLPMPGSLAACLPDVISSVVSASAFATFLYAAPFMRSPFLNSNSASSAKADARAPLPSAAQSTAFLTPQSFSAAAIAAATSSVPSGVSRSRQMGPSCWRAASSSGTLAPRALQRPASSSAMARRSPMATPDRVSASTGGSDGFAFLGVGALASPPSASRFGAFSFFGGFGGQSTSGSWKSEIILATSAWSSGRTSSQPARSSDDSTNLDVLRMPFIIWKKGISLCQPHMSMGSLPSPRSICVIFPMRSSPLGIFSLLFLHVAAPLLAYSMV
mmetsp:Transcript_30820/g.104616  ORF Transcript_30820/g.104616 Transcript_30820/m.104616 type:complete len:286 (-) Transcript_30820:104-961(-)